MNSIKKLVALFISLIVMCVSLTISAFALESTVNDESINQKSSYQDVLDRLNEEYGYSMTLSQDAFEKNASFKNPTTESLSEFERTLRESIEFDISVNRSTKDTLDKLGYDGWEPVPYLGKSYNLPVNASYMNSSFVNTL